MANQPAPDIEKFYDREKLSETIYEALKDTGIPANRLKVDDLAAVDEFHIRGRKSTAELAELLSVDTGDRVLDVGCGLGGACRYLAHNYDIEAVGVDITDAYCRLARSLTEHTGLDDHVRFEKADALNLPFEAEQFDAVVTLHTQMNIADKQQFYGEINRVLKPGGRFAFYDIFAVKTPIHFPVPWATDPSISFLVTSEEVRDILKQTGLSIDHWQDDTTAGLLWFRQKLEKVKQEGPPPLGLHLLMGAGAPEKMKNVARNLEENRIALIQAVTTKQ